MLTRNQIISALKHLGKLAQAQGKTIELLVVGGVALMLGGHQGRLSTHDVDVVILAPSPARWVRELAYQVAEVHNGINTLAQWLRNSIEDKKSSFQNRSYPVHIVVKRGILESDPSHILAEESFFGA
jgi:hypothetical protein